MSKHLNQERLANHSTFLFSRAVVVQLSAELALDQEALGLRPAATKLFPGEPVNSQICLVITFQSFLCSSEVNRVWGILIMFSNVLVLVNSTVYMVNVSISFNSPTKLCL